MNKRVALLLLSICLSTTLCAQEQPPKLLREAAHCLAIKTHPNATVLSLGYLVDRKSYSGEKVLYVVVYRGPSRSEGMVFTIVVKQQDRHRMFDIQNNAKFVRSKSGIDGVDFVEPSLGGTWTQEHLVAAIKRIERRPRFTVRVKDVLAPCPAIECASYADSK